MRNKLRFYICVGARAQLQFSAANHAAGHFESVSGKTRPQKSPHG
jgi:hypothetical protein